MEPAVDDGPPLLPRTEGRLGLLPGRRLLLASVDGRGAGERIVVLRDLVGGLGGARVSLGLAPHFPQLLAGGLGCCGRGPGPGFRHVLAARRLRGRLDFVAVGALLFGPVLLLERRSERLQFSLRLLTGRGGGRVGRRRAAHQHDQCDDQEEPTRPLMHLLSDSPPLCDAPCPSSSPIFRFLFLLPLSLAVAVRCEFNNRPAGRMDFYVREKKRIL